MCARLIAVLLGLGLLAAPGARAADTASPLALDSRTVTVTARFGIGFQVGRCAEAAGEYCSMAARLYHAVGARPDVRIGVVAGSVAGQGSGRIGFILNPVGEALLKRRPDLRVSMRGSVVDGASDVWHFQINVRLRRVR